jgi:deoxycytidylate deaminase
LHAYEGVQAPQEVQKFGTLDWTGQREIVGGLWFAHIVSEEPAGPQVYVGLITPLGVDTDLLVDALNEAFHHYGYTSRTVRYSRQLEELGDPIPDLPEVRTRELIRRGDELAAKYGADAVARLGLRSLVGLRKDAIAESPNKNSVSPGRRAWIFRSIKRTEELALLRQTYGRSFFALAVHATYSTRLSREENQLLLKHPSWNEDEIKKVAQSLLAADQSEDVSGFGKSLPAQPKFGQNVRKAFPLADVIVSGNDADSLRRDATRFVRILFGENEVPTPAEHAMTLAESTAALSSSLSRKVGACLVNEFGEVISVGANEVPRAGGGQYTAAVASGRDEEKGHDFNTVSLRRLVADFILRLGHDGKLNSEWSKLAADEPDGLSDRAFNFLRQQGSEVTSLIEFQRAVHAEVAALLDAGRRGAPTRNTILYTTTYPCHLCMKEIVAAGVSRVFWIAPYDKSRAQAMFGEAIRGTIDLELENESVSVEPFIGVTPRAYHQLFVTEEEYRRKTESGEVLHVAPESALPRVGDASPDLSVVEREKAAVAKLPEHISLFSPETTADVSPLSREEPSDERTTSE